VANDSGRQRAVTAELKTAKSPDLATKAFIKSLI
jgi:hypothetical protein